MGRHIGLHSPVHMCPSAHTVPQGHAHAGRYTAHPVWRCFHSSINTGSQAHPSAGAVLCRLCQLTVMPNCFLVQLHSSQAAQTDLSRHILDVSVVTCSEQEKTCGISPSSWERLMLWRSRRCAERKPPSALHLELVISCTKPLEQGIVFEAQPVVI